MSDAVQPMTVIAPREGSSSEARCTVGLLTWNAGEDGVDCARRIVAQTEAPLELIWIDNASIDGTVRRLHRRCRALPKPFVNPRNLGFCTGHNQALAACRTRYYLALNQDAILERETVERLCDWMDKRPELAMTAPLLLMEEEGEGSGEPRLWSGGMVFPRARFAFELGMGAPATERWRRRRIVPGVDGSAMMLRVDACHQASLDPQEIFADRFFAYGEELDLAMRLARAGFECGVEGTTTTVHRGRSSGGFARSTVRALFFRNHWLATLRNEPLGLIVRELPYLLRGELQYWLPEYAKKPLGFVLALFGFLRHAPAARRFYREFERKFGPTRKRLENYKKRSLEELRAGQK